MFTKKTVFVVGAGASKELGLPIGNELKDWIAQKLDFGSSQWSRETAQNAQILGVLGRECKSPEEHHAHICAGNLISDAMPLAISIDNYLHTHSENESVVLMGKLGIASSILQAESRSSIFYNPSKSNRFSFEKNQDVWLSTFCKMLTENVKLNEIETIFDNVAFVVFNYDRCIEHYLSHALAAYFDIAFEKACELVNKLTIIHPYGQVGYLPWQEGGTNGGLRFGDSDIYEHQLLSVAKQIRTFTEQVDDDDAMEQLRAVLMTAQTVVYLGFSYGEMNMDLMRIDQEGSKKTSGSQIFGTSLGLSNANSKVVERDIRLAFSNGSIFGYPTLASLTCNDFLNEYWKPIMR